MWVLAFLGWGNSYKDPNINLSLKFSIVQSGLHSLLEYIMLVMGGEEAFSDNKNHKDPSAPSQLVYKRDKKSQC